MIDLFKIKEDFSFLVKEAEPWTLTQFVMWLDLKLSEFKTKGYMILGEIYSHYKCIRVVKNCISGVMVDMLVLSEAHRGFESQSGQSKELVFAPSPLSIQY